jgi:3-oxoadipate enol-lactonase
MPHLHFIQQGQGPVVLLSHALGCDLSMWDGVATALAHSYTVLRYDHRGHGQSAASEGAFSIDDLADDAAELIQSQGVGPVHFVGLSLGGMTGQALGARHPHLLRSLVIANSASHYDAAAQTLWQARIDTVQAQGLAAIAEGAMRRWFTPEFRDPAHPGSHCVSSLRAVLESTAQQPYAQACAAVKNIDLGAGNRTITCPTLVIAGSRDEATPPALSEHIARSIPGAQLRSLDAAHLSAVEQPEAFAALLLEFWQGL